MEGGGRRDAKSSSELAGTSRGPWAAVEVRYPQSHPQGGTLEVPVTGTGLGHLPKPGGPQVSPEKPSSVPDPTGCGAGPGVGSRISKGLFLFPSEVVHFPQRAPAAVLAIRETEAQPNVCCQFTVS